MTPSSYCASMILGMRHLDVNFKGNVESIFGSDVNLPVEDEEAGFDLRARACPKLSHKDQTCALCWIHLKTFPEGKM